MKNIFTYAGSATGVNHLADGRPCQDRSYAEEVEYAGGNGRAVVLLVSDGHGSVEHYRSDIGAGLAIESALEALPHILELFDGVTVSRGVAAASMLSKADDSPVDPLFESTARMFFTRISALWSGKVLVHVADNPLPEPSVQGPAHPYGCTLIGAAVTDRYWFAFQLGDGAVAGVGVDGRTLTPVPGDSRCRHGRTTSMSRHGASDFRYGYSTEMPAALMLCTDGISDCMPDAQALTAGIIGPIAEAMLADGGADVCREIDAELPEMSRAYGGDDVSVALWMNRSALPDVIEALRAQNIAAAFQGYTTAKRELVNTEKSIADIKDSLTANMLVVDEEVGGCWASYDADADMLRENSTLSSLRSRQRQLLDDLDTILLSIENFDRTPSDNQSAGDVQSDTISDCETIVDIDL